MTLHAICCWAVSLLAPLTPITPTTTPHAHLYNYFAITFWYLNLCEVVCRSICWRRWQTWALWEGKWQRRRKNKLGSVWGLWFKTQPSTHGTLANAKLLDVEWCVRMWLEHTLPHQTHFVQGIELGPVSKWIVHWSNCYTVHVSVHILLQSLETHSL